MNAELVEVGGVGGAGLDAKSVDDWTRTRDEENVIIEAGHAAASVVTHAKGGRWWLPVLENVVLVHCSGGRSCAVMF